MALSMDKTLDTGVTAAYWKISGVSLDVKNSSGIVYLDLYVDAASSQANRKPIGSDSILLNAQQYAAALVDRDLLTFCYDQVKLDPRFVTAASV